MSLFLDTNILLDIALKRSNATQSIEVIKLSKRRGERLYCSWHSLSTLDYILSKEKGGEYFRSFLKHILLEVKIAPVEEHFAIDALLYDSDDYEDAMQIVCAKGIDASGLITRDQSGFRLSPIPVMTPQEYLDS